MNSRHSSILPCFTLILCRRTSSQLVCLNCALTLDKEIRGMKEGILKSFQSGPKPVVLSWFFPRQIINKIYLILYTFGLL